jgi:creatinine amidohydrolase/Fe(II)-dependent formamide hydrolase-like protein
MAGIEIGETRVTMRRFFLALILAGATALAHARSVYVEDLTWLEVRDAIAGGATTAIVYAGSTEQKGPHMAVGQHNVVAHYVGGRIAETLGNALVYPVLPFAITGDPAAKTGHMKFPGSVSLAPRVFADAIRDLAMSAISAGFREIYLMGDHGDGQDELRNVAQSLDKAWVKKGVRVRYVSDLYFKTRDQVRQYAKEHQIAWVLHAGVWDTSELMFLDTGHKWIRADKVAESDGAKATPEMGKIFLDYKIDAAVNQIRAFRSARR